MQQPLEARVWPGTQFTLPDLENSYTAALQAASNLNIPHFVARQLLDPIRPVGLGNVPAAGTSVPETSIDENCQSLICEKEVRSTQHRRFAKLPAVDGISNHQAPESPLSCGVRGSSDRPHVARTLLGGLEFQQFSSSLQLNCVMHAWLAERIRLDVILNTSANWLGQ